MSERIYQVKINFCSFLLILLTKMIFRRGLSWGLCYKDKLAFEGEFLNDRWNGKGKEYNMEGELVFEGIKMEMYYMK